MYILLFAVCSLKFEVWNLSWVKNAELIEVTGEPHYASLYIDYTAGCSPVVYMYTVVTAWNNH